MPQVEVAQIGWVGLGWSLLLIFFTLAVSRWQRLDLEKRLLIGCIRTVVQLIAIGYVLGWIIGARHIGYVIAAMTFQLGMAAWTAGGLQTPPLRHGRLIALVALLPAYLLVITVLLALVVRPEPWWNPRVVLTLGGMLLGNAMTGVALVLNRYRSELRSHREVVAARIALGASWRQAVTEERRAAAYAALLPTVSGLLTVGLVSLPGMMTGQIIAGANPLQAVQYQIVVMFMIAAVVAVATTIALEVITRHGKLEASRNNAA
jgi:putative ABC transport system permease protein